MEVFMQVEISKTVNFITDNLDFFSAPFLDQKGFNEWVIASSQEQNIRNLTDSLSVPLTNLTSYLTQFNDALLGKH
jgi:hypothetical protein